MKIKNLIICLLIPIFFGCSDDPEFEGEGIHNYFCSSGRMRLGSGMRNASGLTFNPDTGTIFIIQDSPSWIHEVTTEGKHIRIVQISNANDTEGIAYIGNNLFAILEESTSKIYVCKIDDSTNSIDFSKAEKVITVNKPHKNTGLEGVTYLPEVQLFFAVKEKDPKTIYCIDNETDHIKIPWDLQKIKIDDVSDICFNPITGHLLLLSHESFVIVEVDLKGNEISRLALKEKRNGLKKDIKKAEGITIDPKTGNVYICGEKEEFYIFEDGTKK